METPTGRVAQRSPSVRYEPLMLVLAAFAAGIGWDRLAPFDPRWSWCLASGCWLVWAMLALARFSRSASMVLCLGIMALGAAWHHARWHWVAHDHLVVESREEIQPICLEGVLEKAPRIVPAPPTTPLRPFPIGDRSRCELAIYSIRHGTHWRAASGSSRLIVDGHLLGCHAGDTIRLFAHYERPTPRQNPGEFDFAEFERAEGRYLSLSAESPECVQVIRRVAWWNPRHWLDAVRRQGDAQLRKTMSPRQAPLATAVLLGEREFLDADRNEQFLVTGTVHLLAISGLNLGILVYLFWTLGNTGLLSRRGTLLAAFAFAVSYALLTDAEPPVTRAAVLISVFCVARWSGRPASPWQVLAFAALVVLAVNPTTLFHVGAQLSFLAVAVLAWFRHSLAWRIPQAPLDRLIASTRPWPTKAVRGVAEVVRQIVVSGTLVWLFSLPLVWLRYNLISPVAIGLNPIVWLPMTIALFAGFAVLVVGWLVPPLGWLAGKICELSLTVLETAITWSKPLPGGFVWLPAPPIAWVLCFYLAVGILAMFSGGRLRRSWVLTGFIAWFTCAYYLAVPGPLKMLWPERGIAATFVSVGHGTAVLLELPRGKTLLYDCGRLGSPLSGVRPISAVLWSRGITHLDAVVISHADSDHYNALPDLLERFSVGGVYVSTVMWRQMSPGLRRLKAEIEQHQVPIQELQAGDKLRLDSPETRLAVLHPPRAGVLGSDNANSIVLLVEHANRKLLLTGDLELRGLSDLLAEEPLDCDLVLAPHHGSTRSNPSGFAVWCQPEYVVISGARDYELGRDVDLVAQAFRAKHAQVFHTAENGAIRFELSRTGVSVQPQRSKLAE